MGKVSSIRLSPELELLKESTDVPFNKRVNVIAERYSHLVNTFPCPALTNDTIEVLQAIPAILTMRGSMIEHLPWIIMNNKALSKFPAKQIHAAYREVKPLNNLQRMICIERLEHGD